MQDLQETKAKVRREKTQVLGLPQIVPGMRVFGVAEEFCDARTAAASTSPDCISRGL
jgi:hypothetical protein